MASGARAGVIRPASLEDLDRTAALVEAAFASPRALSRAEIKALIRRQTVSLLEVGGRLVGVIALEPLADHLFIPVIAVDRACRGEGHGRRLIDFAAGEARRRQQRVLRLFADPNDAAGCAFYRQVGFRPEAAPAGAPGRSIALVRHLDRTTSSVRE